MKEEMALPNNPPLGRILTRAIKYAREYGSLELKPDHLFLGILDEDSSIAVRGLEELGVTKDALLERVFSDESFPIRKSVPKDIPILEVQEMKAVYQMAYVEAQILGDAQIEPEHLLLAILSRKKSVFCRVLKEVFNVDHELVVRKISELRPE